MRMRPLGPTPRGRKRISSAIVAAACGHLHADGKRENWRAHVVLANLLPASLLRAANIADEKRTCRCERYRSQKMRSLERRFAGKLNIKTPPLVGGATVACSSSLKRRPTSADSRVRTSRVLSDTRANEAASPAKQKGICVSIARDGGRSRAARPTSGGANCLGNSPQVPAIGIVDGYKLKCTVVVPQLVLVDVRLAGYRTSPTA